MNTETRLEELERRIEHLEKHGCAVAFERRPELFKRFDPITIEETDTQTVRVGVSEALASSFARSPPSTVAVDDALQKQQTKWDGDTLLAGCETAARYYHGCLSQVYDVELELDRGSADE